MFQLVLQMWSLWFIGPIDSTKFDLTVSRQHTSTLVHSGSQLAPSLARCLQILGWPAIAKIPGLGLELGFGSGLGIRLGLWMYRVRVRVRPFVMADLNIGVGAQSTLGGTKFCPKNMY